jgi:hypothetical protein
MPRRLKTFRKWSAWAHKVRDESGVDAALDAQNAALQAFRAAQIAVAKLVPRDLTQLAPKSVLAGAYEHGPHPGILARRSLPKQWRRMRCGLLDCCQP